ncbi:hypothetical protein N9B25_00590, partial [bacterium]|nr:hypothetical protein [bacterium]
VDVSVQAGRREISQALADFLGVREQLACERRRLGPSKLAFAITASVCNHSQCLSSQPAFAITASVCNRSQWAPFIAPV